MWGAEPVKAARRVVKTVLEREFKTEVGRINAIGVALTFFLIVVLGMEAVYEETISRIFPDGGNHDFPELTVILVFAGVFLTCTVIVGLLAPVLPPGDSDGNDQP